MTNNDNNRDPWYYRDAWTVPIACFFGAVSGGIVSVILLFIR